MTDPKQQQPKPGDPKAAAKAKAEEKKVFIRNTTKTPYVVPAADGAPNITIRPNRVTAVNADAWQAFKATPFGQSLIDEEIVEEATEDEHANQPETEQDKAAKEDASEEEAQRAHGKKGRK
jgi:RPA family protein